MTLSARARHQLNRECRPACRLLPHRAAMGDSLPVGRSGATAPWTSRRPRSSRSEKHVTAFGRIDLLNAFNFQNYANLNFSTQNGQLIALYNTTGDITGLPRTGEGGNRSEILSSR